ncbi:protein shisa-5-like isoform X1 [Gymnodraco acuticeps]|uniref:Protein shisa-5-like isoform X1 n=1 Tax=Gymnodraco acuticeps TaxID=8218 RepID=A0A6P8TAC6_GYMAC|nr:protein shisa-5-like isoform X1 [Gymnodraco acuticeps]
MVSGVLFSLVCAFCVILIPAVWADDCSSYVDSDGNQHNTQQCGIQYCCGNCQKQYCCSDKTNRFRRSKQKLCEGSLAKRSNPIPIIGIILASVIPIIICVVVVIVCCVVPCCFFYKKCRKGRNQRPRTARNTPTVVNVPQQPHPPPGYHPSYPGYLFVSAQPGYGGVPLPSAPPSYLEATDPACPSSAYTPGLPMTSYPGQPYAPPPHSDEFAPLPYNPSYGPDP